MPRVCFWTTTFQADNQALAHYLAQQPGFEVVVAMDRPEAYLAEPVASLLPFGGKLVDRGRRSTRKLLRALAPDVLVIDNHLPAYRIAPRVLVLWHGFGWRCDDLSGTLRNLRAHVGEVTAPNPAFRWAAFGDWDRAYRIEHSGLAPTNVLALGSPYSDLLLPGSALRSRFSREAVRGCYRIDICDRKTVTLGLTWHHGGALAHWGNDAELLQQFVEFVGERQANVLVRMHDRHRYEKQDIQRMESLQIRFEHVHVKFKSEHPDSLVDLLVTDVLVSNYSSLLNAFYFTGKPSVHIEPHDASRAEHHHRVIRRGKLVKQRIADPATLWKLGPDQVGGLCARSFPELCQAVDRALRDEHCCEQVARAFCERYITDPDGTTRERFASMLEGWVASDLRTGLGSTAG
jgi:hypothetical protein